jgi:hypothetical protein
MAVSFGCFFATSSQFLVSKLSMYGEQKLEQQWLGGMIDICITWIMESETL